MPTLQLHVLPPSHPCMTVEAGLRFKGLEYERVELAMTGHNDEMERLYGEGHKTVPGLLVDGEPVHGSRAILERIEALAPDAPSLFPEPIAEAVREAERWGDDELQDLGRRLPWGALHFRPEAMGVLGGGGPLDPAGTDYAIRFARASWKYHGITAERLAADLASLPALLDHVDALAADGIIGGEKANAADFQIGATLRVLRLVGDLRPLIDGRPAHEVTLRWFDELPGEIPRGAYPAGWVPER